MALRRPCASQRATKPALFGLLHNAMSVSHILGVMSCKWPNFTAATAFEIQPPAIFLPAAPKWVGGLRVSGFLRGSSGWVGCGFRVLITLGGVGWEKKRNPGWAGQKVFLTFRGKGASSICELASSGIKGQRTTPQVPGAPAKLVFFSFLPSS